MTPKQEEFARKYVETSCASSAAEAAAKAGRVSGTKKHNALVGYINTGQEPVAVVFESGLDDDKALALEKELIAAIGYEKLCNGTSGAGSKWARALAQLDELEQRIMPYDQWVRSRQSKPEHVEMHGVVMGMIANTKMWIAEHAGR